MFSSWNRKIWGKDKAPKHEFENAKLGIKFFKNYSRKIKCALKININWYKMNSTPPKLSTHLSNLSISNKLIEKIVLYRIIVAIILTLFRKITLNLLCIPCYKLKNFIWLFKGTRWAIKNFNLKKLVLKVVFAESL